MRSEKRARSTKTRTPRRSKTTSREGDAPAAFLHAHGINVSPEVMERMVAAAVDDLPRTLYPTDPSHDLTKAERDALIRGGLDLTPRDLGEDDPLARTAADYAALLRRSKTVAETAKLLGVNESRVRQRLNSKPPTLYGFKLEGEWRVPDFIFVGKRLVSGIGELASKLRPDLHPVGFFRWFTMPDPDLDVAEGEEPLSPRLWLLSGHSPGIVADLAAEL